MLADSPRDLCNRDIVFTTVSAPADLIAVTSGEDGLLTGEVAPQLLIDCSTVSEEASSEVRAAAAARGTAMLSAPVSGNAKVVAAGKLTIVASGPSTAFTVAARSGEPQ